MKTIKVIDLLNKIANGEEVPTEIKIYDEIYKYDDFNKTYSNSKNVGLFEIYNGRILNEEVEIIEDTPKEDKKIEKLDLQYKDIIYNPNFNANILMYCDNLQSKINEIIDKINGEIEISGVDE